MEHTLPPEHFLSLPRPGVTRRGAVPDTSTLAAHDFDVDVRTGFMPPQPPLARLSRSWEPWEVALSDALTRKLKLGDRNDLDETDRLESETWRQGVRRMPIISTAELLVSEVLLRRAHHVLCFLLQIYIHTSPPAPDATPIHIPESISIPILQVSSNLVVPPIITYSDNVLYNWDLTVPQSPSTQSLDPSHLRSQTTFTGTPSEEHFYLVSARIELAGVAALSLLRSALDEAFVGDELSLRRISQYLEQLVEVIDKMTVILNGVRDGCDPRIFYEEIRPWFRGQGKRPWIFDGAEAAGFAQPTELSGPSAGQSSIIHVLDIFLGIDQYSHSNAGGGGTPVPSLASQVPTAEEPSFLKRMEFYMPRHHRAFLNHLKETPRPVRNIVTAEDPLASAEQREIRRGLKEAYNASIAAVKRFRDAHIRIATLYIINQARHVHSVQAPSERESSRQREPEQGTGGTDLVPFLKGVRDRTAAAMLKGGKEV